MKKLNKHKHIVNNDDYDDIFGENQQDLPIIKKKSKEQSQINQQQFQTVRN